MIIELGDNPENFTINAENFQCAFTGLNQSFFVKAANKSSLSESEPATNSTLLICHTLRIIPHLEDYFAYSSNVQYYPSYLPIHSSLNDRIKILMEKRYVEFIFSF